MVSPSLWSTRNIIFATLLIAASAALLVFLIRFAQVVFVIFLALTLSTAVEPLITYLQGRNVRRLNGTLLVYGGILLLSALFLGLIFPLIFNQAAVMGTKLPDYYDSLREIMLTSRVSLVRALGAQLPLKLQDLLNNLLIQPGGNAFELMGQVSAALFDLLLTFLLSFYWTLDSERAIRFFILRLPENRRDPVRESIATFKDKLGAYIRGQALLCLAVGVMAVIAYVAIRLPYAFSLGLVYGVFEAVPMIGPILGLVPALLLALAAAPDKVLWVIVAGVVIQQLENNLLVPRVMGRTVGVNPIVSILAIGAFSLLFGIGGAILAVPVAAVMQVALDRFVFSNPSLLPTAVGTPTTLPATGAAGAAANLPGGLSSPPETPSPAGAGPAQSIVSEALIPTDSLSPAEMTLPAGRGRLSLLHLELHELTQDIRSQQRKKDVLADPLTDEVEDEMEATAERLYEIIVHHTANLQNGNSNHSPTV